MIIVVWLVEVFIVIVCGRIGVGISVGSIDCIVGNLNVLVMLIMNISVRMLVLWMLCISVSVVSSVIVIYFIICFSSMMWWCLN